MATPPAAPSATGRPPRRSVGRRETTVAERWSPLYRTAGVAALITAVLGPVQLAVFMAYPFPDTVAGWYLLTVANPTERNPAGTGSRDGAGAA